MQNKDTATSLLWTRKHGLLLCASGVLCVLAPGFAKRSLDRKVQVDLAAAASQSFGVPIHLGEASVGLTGTLELRHIRIGNILSAESVTASIVPPASEGGKPMAELRIDSPVIDLRVFEDGTTNLDKLLRSTRKEGGSSRGAGQSTGGNVGQVRLVDGKVHITLAGAGELWAQGVDASLVDNKLHVIAGKTEVDIRHKDWRLQGSMHRAAMDYERHGQGLVRMLSDGGSFQWSGPRGRAVLRDLVLSNQVDDEFWQIRAKTGIREATGSFTVRANPELNGYRFAVELEDAPLALAGPWLPDAVLPAQTTATGDLHLRKTKDWQAAASLAFTGLQLHSADLAEKSLEMDAELNVEARYHQTTSGNFLDATIHHLKTKELDLSGQFTGQWLGNSRVPELAKLSLALSEVDCDSALSSLPSALRPTLAGLELRGRMHSSIDLLMSRSKREDTSIAVSSGIGSCRVLRDPPGANAGMLSGAYLHRGPHGESKLLSAEDPDFSSLRSLPEYVPMAFVVAEDARFFLHNGFDAHQIENSLAIDLKSGRFARGGSTISQQLVKNLFLDRKRSLARKLQEAILTWRLEEKLSKKRILEIYLNIIELGDENTYGITAAAERWFGIPARDLSILQTAFLAAMTPEPTSMSARIRSAGRLDPVSKARVEVILRVMKRGKVITTYEYNRALRQTLHFSSEAIAVQ